MFTGLVEEVGHVRELVPSGDGARLSISATASLEDVALGDSISVNGVCLTVTDYDSSGFSADVMRQTLDVSNLGQLEPGSPVNLERALRLGDRLGGHIVQGHVDGQATLLERRAGEQWDVLRFAVDSVVSKYLVPKGSITVQGVSLTVSALDDDWFEVSLIPATLANTTLGTMERGQSANVETDVLARHVERLLQVRNG